MDALLKLVADNPALSDALKAVLFKQFDDLPFSESASDELLGQVTRARITGRRMVEKAFAEIAQHKSVQKRPEHKNEAR